MHNTPNLNEINIQPFANDVKELAIKFRLQEKQRFTPIHALSNVFDLALIQEKTHDYETGINHMNVADAINDRNSRLTLEEVATVFSATEEEWKEMESSRFQREYQGKQEEIDSFHKFKKVVTSMRNSDIRTMMVTVLNNEVAGIQQGMDALKIQQVGESQEPNTPYPIESYQKGMRELNNRITFLNECHEQIMMQVSNPTPPAEVPKL
jgi:hypothetical protein